MRAALLDGAPDIPVHGEEEGGERAAVGWLVDPLDGTANFLHAFPVVGVSIALVADGEPVVGVVHAPMLGETYWATAGGGAWRDGTPLARARPARVEEAICATGFPFRKKRERLDEYFPVFERALRTFEDLRRAGVREPRPRVDRGGRVRRLLRAGARAVGRRRRRAARARGRRRRHRLAGRRRAPGSTPATSSPPRPQIHARILELIQRLRCVSEVRDADLRNARRSTC